MLWLKALHVVFVVTWFAGLFYLPRLFIYHAAATDRVGIERFLLMEKRLFVIMSIGAACAITFGCAMILAAPAYLSEPWLQAKLVCVTLLVGYHLWCYRLMLGLRTRRDGHSARWLRWFNEVPSVLLLVIVILAVVKPRLY
jgi:protoporphyrinogen IX oxidase